MPVSRSAAFAALFALLAGTGLTYLCLPVHFIVLTVEEQHMHCRLNSTHFRLDWQHSVEKTRWQEQYQMQADQLLLTETTLVSFGAGTPDREKVIQQQDGKVRISLQRPMKEINWVISRRMQGIIVLPDQQWEIYRDFPDYSVVHISVKQDPRWKTYGIKDCL